MANPPINNHPRFSSRAIRKCIAVGLAFACSTTLAVESTPVSTAQILAAPMHFEANEGQTDEAVRFLSRGPGYCLFLTSTQAVLSLHSSEAGQISGRGRERAKQPKVEEAQLRLTLLGANPRSTVEGVDQFPGTANYFIGNDPGRWHRAIPTYGKVKYRDIYPGVDVVYYGNQRQVEYDFIVSPKADPKRIAISFEGAERLEIDDQGGLTAHLATGEVRWKKPFAYQEDGGGRLEIPARFVLKNRREISFQLAHYDSARPLIIDPVLMYATYLGGSKSDSVNGIAVDSGNNVYVVGDTA